MNYSLATPLQNISRISPAYQKRLLKLGIKNLGDLLYHFPRRYDDFSKIVAIADLKPEETATIQGVITSIKNTRAWHRKMTITEARISDESGAIRAVWFNQPFIADTLTEGQLVSLSGKTNIDKGLYFSNPSYEKIDRNSQLKHTGRIVPVYPETERLTSRWLRYINSLFLPGLFAQIQDPLPPQIIQSQKLLGLKDALRQIHFPETAEQAAAARSRLAFDELFSIQLFTLRQKLKWQEKCALKIPFNEPLIKDFVASLPFKLTEAQRKAAWEIIQDLDKIKPMNRLLEGDVGSGKTVVAAIAALSVARAGYQAAFMAPTEILARQHYDTIRELFTGLNVKIGLITGSEKTLWEPKLVPNWESRLVLSRESKLALKTQDKSWRPAPIPRLNDRKRKKDANLDSSFIIHNSDIIIGTHALIQKNISFRNLALAVVDEQHRFGVDQRAALQKNIIAIKDGVAQKNPHLLTMTATPIPRTLALTIYGDLDISLLDEIPGGREKTITRIVAPEARQSAYEFIRQQVAAGRQVFVVCPRIEIKDKAHEDENIALGTLKPTSGHGFYNISSRPTGTNIIKERGGLTSTPQLRGQAGENFTLLQSDIFVPSNNNEIKAVKQEHEKLSQKIFPDLKIAMLHGKMKPTEKEKTMTEFKARKTDILISTSVVEVGIDVPNATVMMIEGAEHFGLAQLHQFRGRVGRGEHQSYCFLFTDSASAQTRDRLKALVASQNGFELAQKDLELRGPGDFYGTRQWGLPDLSMASLADTDLIKKTRQEAAKILTKDPQLKNYPLLKDKLKKFRTEVHME